MNAQQVVNLIEREEVKNTNAADKREVLRQERFYLLAAMKSGNAAKINAALKEAKRVYAMWENA